MPDRAAGRRPLTIVDGPGGWSLDHHLTDGIDGFHPFGAGDPLLGAKAELRARGSASAIRGGIPQAELTPAIEPTADDRHQVVLAGELSIDPSTAAAGKPLPPGTYGVWFVGKILGTVRRRLLVVPKTTEGQPRWMVSGSAAVVSRFDWTGATPGCSWRSAIARSGWARTCRRTARPRSRSGLALPVRLAGRLPADPVPVTLTIADQPVVAQLTIGARRNLGLLTLLADADLRADHIRRSSLGPPPRSARSNLKPDSWSG